MRTIARKLYDRMPFFEKRFRIREKLKARRLYFAILRSTTNKPNTKIIIINHHFDLDISSLEYALKSFPETEIGILSPTPLYDWTRYYMPRLEDDIKGYYKPELAACQHTFRRHLTKVLRAVKKKRPSLAFLSPSDIFFWVREFIMACKDAGIPFIVLDKEGTICPYDFKYLSRDFKCYMPPISDHVLVWSQRQKDFYLLAGFPEEKLHIVGQPRSDFWFHPDMWMERNHLFSRIGADPGRKTVLYFDFENNNYINKEHYLAGFTWDEFLDDIHSTLFEAAERNPEINFIFKLHPQAQWIEDVKVRVKETGLKNLFVATGADLSNHLIIHSDLVIGGHSTALLDAMLARKPVIYVFWRNAPEFKQNLIRFDENEGIDVARSNEEFKRILERYIQDGFSFKPDEALIQKRNGLLDVFFYKPDGNVGNRVMDIMKGLIGGHRDE